jgi:putative ABC transport system substrate-binding protein
MLNTEISAKRVELLREVLPKVGRVAVLRDPAVPAQDLSATEAVARSLGLWLRVFSAGRPEEFRGAFEAARKADAEALIVLASPVFNTYRQRLVDLAAENRLVAVYEHRDFPEAGGLMAYGPNLRDMNRRAAKYIDRVLKGAKPADLPVEQPTVFELVINMKTARTLGLTIPPSVLARADRIIE